MFWGRVTVEEVVDLDNWFEVHLVTTAAGEWLAVRWVAAAAVDWLEVHWVAAAGDWWKVCWVERP